MITPSEELAALRERVKCDELTFALRDDLLALCERLVRDAERWRWLVSKDDLEGKRLADAADAALSAKQSDKQKEKGT